MLKKIEIKTNSHNELVDITDKLKEVISNSKISSGLCVLYVPHTTAGLIINENADPSVKKDLLNALETTVPKIDFKHTEGNSDAHFKSALVGKEKTLIIENSSLLLGTWDGIYFLEADGPRNRKVFVKLVSD